MMMVMMMMILLIYYYLSFSIQDEEKKEEEEVELVEKLLDLLSPSPSFNSSSTSRANNGMIITSDRSISLIVNSDEDDD
jgi:hypothetical protein